MTKNRRHWTLFHGIRREKKLYNFWTISNKTGHCVFCGFRMHNEATLTVTENIRKYLENLKVGKQPTAPSTSFFVATYKTLKCSKFMQKVEGHIHMNELCIRLRPCICILTLIFNQIHLFYFSLEMCWSTQTWAWFSPSWWPIQCQPLCSVSFCLPCLTR